jgi:hypothetical protein
MGRVDKSQRLLTSESYTEHYKQNVTGNGNIMSKLTLEEYLQLGYYRFCTPHHLFNSTHLFTLHNLGSLSGITNP